MFELRVGSFKPMFLLEDLFTVYFFWGGKRIMKVVPLFS